VTPPCGGPNRLGDFSTNKVQKKKAPLKPNIELVPTWSIGMQFRRQWVESKFPLVTHHVDQNHMDTDNNPCGWINHGCCSVNPLDQAQPS